MRFFGKSIEMEVHTEAYSRFQFRGKGSEYGGVSNIPKYPSSSNFFSLRMHYGGFFSEGPGACYLLGKVVISDYCHPRNMHMQRFYETAYYLGLEWCHLFMYKKPDKTTSDGLELVTEDADLRDIGRLGLRNRVVDLYFLFRLRNRGIGLQPFVESTCNSKSPLSNSKRCTAHCKSKKWCSWKVSINYRNAIDSWELTGLMLDHTCSSTVNHGCTTSRYLSKRYKEDITIMPTIKVSQLVDKVKKDLNINISRDKAFNIKKIALAEIEGDLRKQYVLLRDYCFELLRMNPNSTVLLKTERNAAGRELFHRLYVCFDACKRGFIEGCRPLIGVDGCHLTGPHKGILLAAIGMDPNDQIFPVAYAVVEIENRSSWLWFLSALQSDLNIQNSKGWTLLSDKQKGLKSAMETLLPNVEHRLCTWHMYKNFRGPHPGLELKELVWAAAKCTNKKVFAHKMSDIQKRKPSAYEWLLTYTDPKEWSRAHFSTETKCDILVNNIVECFNNVILHARDKPIMTMLEALRFYFMDRLQKKRIFIEKMQGELGPKIHRKLEKNMSDSNMFRATHSGGLLYEVKGFRSGKYKVNLMTRTCGCNRWELTGIPCQHAIAAINMTNEEPGSFVHDYYSKESYQKAYKYIIYPMNGPELWERSGLPSLLPPRDLRLPGRPAKARRKDAMEKTDEKNKKKKKKGEFQTLPRAKRMRPYQCTHCKQTGHNVARCPLKQGTATENTPEAEAEHSTKPASPNNHSIGNPECNPTELASTSTSQQAKISASKSKVKKAQTCTSCGCSGHNITTCGSSIANMKFRPSK